MTHEENETDVTTYEEYDIVFHTGLKRYYPRYKKKYMQQTVDGTYNMTNEMRFGSHGTLDVAKECIEKHRIANAPLIAMTVEEAERHANKKKASENLGI